MPNHVHVLVHVWQTPLSKLARSWKQFVQTETNLATQEHRPPARHTGAERQPPAPRESSVRRPSFRWEREYWDTYMRDERQERTAIRYIEQNPLNARLCAASGQWPFSNARFRDGYRRLILPRHDDAERRPEA